MRNFNKLAILASAAVALPGCGEMDAKDPNQIEKTKVVFVGAPVADAQITSEDCDVISKVDYPESPKNTSTKAQDDYEVGMSLAHLDEMEKAALDNELPKAKAIAGSLLRESKDEIFGKNIVTGEDARRFLADPKVEQLGLKAECASFAGQISTAESMLERYKTAKDKTDQDIYATDPEDDVELWEGSLAEEIAEYDGDFKKSFRLLAYIDDEGTVTRIEAQDDVELFIGLEAEQQAIDGNAARAAELVKMMDDEGTETRSETQNTVDAIIAG